MVICFWLSTFLVGYVYVIYPVTIWALARTQANKEASSCIASDLPLPNITVLVPAYNEEAVITAKVENCLSLDYPAELLQIVVVSDASTDNTDSIVASFEREAPERLRLHRMEQRGGKTGGINAAMQTIKSDITVFTDTNVTLDVDSLKHIASALSAPSVGGVAGQLTYVNPDASETAQSGGLYWRYEEFIKRNEGLCGSIMGADGSIFAIKSRFYRQLPNHVMDDFCTSMGVVLQGHVFALDPRIKAYEKSAEKSVEEFQRKVRIANRSFNSYRSLSLLGNLGMLDTWKFFSHKWLRWMSFVFLLTALMSNIAIVLSTKTLGYEALLICQVGAYSLALGKHVMPSLRLPFLNAWYYFVMANAANAIGICQSLAGKKTTIWASPSSSR